MGEPIIQIQNLCKTFRSGFLRKRKEAVHDLSLEVFRGEIFGFLGPNGAGKTTTIKSLMGLIFPTSGQVRLFGLPTTQVHAKEKVGFLPEHPYFYEYLTGEEILDFYGRLFDLSSSVRQSRVENLLERVGMKDARDRHLRKYSKGMVQRIGIAQALINDPDLVILDEPMSGLDPMGRKEVRDIIFSLKEQGKTVFFSSHILQDVEMICDRVAIIHEGRLRRIGALREMLQEQQGREVELTVSGLSEEAMGKLEALATRIAVPGARATLILPQSRSDEACNIVLTGEGRIESLVPLKVSLEDLFREVVGR